MTGEGGAGSSGVLQGPPGASGAVGSSGSLPSDAASSFPQEWL